MLEITKYTPDVAADIVSWVTDENLFYLWSAGRLGRFPITADGLNERFISLAKTDGLEAFVMLDESGTAGMFTVRRGGSPAERRLGFIILNPERRGLGYGKKMLSLAAERIFADEQINRLTLGVFDTNLSAIRCYNSIGFQNSGEYKDYTLGGSTMRCLEFYLEKGITHE